MIASLHPSIFVVCLLAQSAAPAARPSAGAPAPTPTSTSGPAEPAPTVNTGPAEPAPPEPSSSATPTLVPPPAPPAGGPAVAAPPSASPSSAPAAAPVPPPAPTDLTPPNNTVGVFGGFAYRLGTVLAPSTGFSFGASFNRRYATLARQIGLGWQADFSFNRFNASVQGVSSDASGQSVSFPGTRTTTSTSFAALQTLTAEVGSSHVWIGAGVGLDVGFLTTPEVALQGQSATSYQPFARAAAGGDFALDGQTSLGLRVGYAKLLTSATVTSGSDRWDLVGDLLDIQGGLFYRFR